ncbi:hypothetical protein HA402_003239 [Bradysia odoriphaga]|nr:hypothetical protein HA402_003239 [Bradysia odoriphaga]
MDKLGHLTFCPTYLGSTIHVSTVVKFPNVAGRAKVEQMMMKEDEKKLLPFCVEPTTMADEFELTNKPKLDKTEFDAMKQFIAEVDDFLKAAHIVTADDALARLEELKKFTPSPESLLVKCLSKDIITALKSSKTKNEKTLLDCIRIGLEHEKLPLGIFAADEECYGQFKDIFEPILKAYYEGVDPDKIEESKWDDGSGNLDNLGFTSELILRTRITCARSVESHSFVPAMNADKLNALKVEVETQLKGTSFQNLCKGTFVALDQLKDSNVIAELKKRQLLFEPENVRLRAAGVTDFSQGRAIFYNDDNNLVVWINEEEHLKFIATRTNDPTKSAPIIKEAFTDLSTAVTKIGLSFEKSESTFWLNECNLTLCPTFLGPAIHVSAVVKLAKAAARGKVEYFAKELKICVKRTTVADEFEVTNKPNLNKTEYDAIKEFVDKLEKLVGRETKLITTIDEAWKRWGEVVSGNADSEISKSKPTDEKELKAEDQKGNTANGKTLLDCIRPGLEDDKMGIYAVDADAYDKFAVIFGKYVETIHGPKLSTPVDGWTGDSSKFLHSDYSSYAKSSRITCRRSFKDFPFIPAMTTTQLRALRATVKAKLEEYDDKGKFYDLAGIDDQTKNELINGGHWFEPVNERLRSVGVKDFTTGRAVFVSKENNLTVWLCEEDHLKFISTAADGDIAKTFEQLKGAVDKFKQVEFHKHNDFGWKTFCPTNLGSTIEATIVLNLPNIAKADAGFSGTFEDYCNTETIQLVGAKVCALPKAANTTSTEYAISNDKKFGKEFDLIMAVYEAAKALAKQETTL